MFRFSNSRWSKLKSNVRLQIYSPASQFPYLVHNFHTHVVFVLFQASHKPFTDNMPNTFLKECDLWNTIHHVVGQQYNNNAFCMGIMNTNTFMNTFFTLKHRWFSSVLFRMLDSQLIVINLNQN